MIVFKKTKDPAFNGRQYSHIECDIDGCGEMAPPREELVKKGGSLMERGWFIAGGKHRCPKHFHHDTPGPSGPVVREANAKNVR